MFSHLTQIFFHKYFSRKNQRQPVQVGQDESRERAGSEESRILSNEGSADSEHEVDEEGSSDVEEDAVWKVRTRRTSGCLFSYAPTGYASHDATRTRR